MFCGSNCPPSSCISSVMACNSYCVLLPERKIFIGSWWGASVIETLCNGDILCESWWGASVIITLCNGVLVGETVVILRTCASMDCLSGLRKLVSAFTDIPERITPERAPIKERERQITDICGQNGMSQLSNAGNGDNDASSFNESDCEPVPPPSPTNSAPEDQGAILWASYVEPVKLFNAFRNIYKTVCLELFLKSLR